MHELSLLEGIVKTVTRVAEEHQVKRIEKLVLQIGEFSSVVPGYLRRVYPIAVKGTVLEGATLCIETVKTVGKCSACGKEFPFSEKDGLCPDCGAAGFLVNGGELIVKEIVVGG